MKNIYKKHAADGDKSKLKVLDDVDWDIIGPQADALLAEQDEVDDMRREAEKRQGEIDRQKEPFTKAVRNTRDLLMGIYGSNPKKLGDYGYDVSSSSGPTAGDTPPTA